MVYNCSSSFLNFIKEIVSYGNTRHIFFSPAVIKTAEGTGRFWTFRQDALERLEIGAISDAACFCFLYWQDGRRITVNA